MTQPAADPADMEAAVERFLQAREQAEGGELFVGLQGLAKKHVAQEVDAARVWHRQEVELRAMYARGLLRILTAQLAIADLVFVAFAWAGRHWDSPAPVVDIWLGAAVAQVLGGVMVVTRHLFPHRYTSPAKGLSAALWATLARRRRRHRHEAG